MHFEHMQATLTELHRETARLIRPVIHGGQVLIVTEHGRQRARLTAIQTPDRKAALESLRAIGPVELPRRK